MDQVVDTETAKEFMKETLDKVNEGTLAAICDEVGQKSEWFQETLDDYYDLIDPSAGRDWERWRDEYRDYWSGVRGGRPNKASNRPLVIRSPVQ